MKIGSKGWVIFIQKLYRFSWMFLTLGLLLRLIYWSSDFDEINQLILFVSRVFMWPAVLIISLITMLAAFDPVRRPLNWSMVYPALKKRVNDFNANGIIE